MTWYDWDGIEILRWPAGPSACCDSTENARFDHLAADVSTLLRHSTFNTDYCRRTTVVCKRQPRGTVGGVYSNQRRLITFFFLRDLGACEAFRHHPNQSLVLWRNPQTLTHPHRKYDAVVLCSSAVNSRTLHHSLKLQIFPSQQRQRSEANGSGPKNHAAPGTGTTTPGETAGGVLTLASMDGRTVQ